LIITELVQNYACLPLYTCSSLVIIPLNFKLPRLFNDLDLVVK